MIRAIWALAILGLSLVACGTPVTPTGSGPTASSPSAGSANPAAALCAALDEHARKVAALGDLDPATSTVDDLKAAGAQAQPALTALAVAFAASGLQAQFGAQFQEIEGGSSGLLQAIQQLPTSASPDEVMGRLGAFGWPEPLSTDQEALFAELRDAAC